MLLGNPQRGSTGKNLEPRDPPDYTQHDLVCTPLVFDAKPPRAGAAVQALHCKNLRTSTNCIGSPTQYGLARHLAHFHPPSAIGDGPNNGESGYKIENGHTHKIHYLPPIVNMSKKGGENG